MLYELQKLSEADVLNWPQVIDEDDDATEEEEDLESPRIKNGRLLN
jgi:hypothetical protein